MKKKPIAIFYSILTLSLLLMLADAVLHGSAPTASDDVAATGLVLDIIFIPRRGDGSSSERVNFNQLAAADR